jgi:anti-anti-sigma regulatory factor
LRTVRTTDPPGLALSGDIDEETYPALVKALSKVPRSHAGIHIDLSAVEFCDLAGLRAILQLPGEGIPVVLSEIPEPLPTLMTILGWDNTPGLTITVRSPGPASKQHD